MIAPSAERLQYLKLVGEIIVLALVVMLLAVGLVRNPGGAVDKALGKAIK